MPRKRANNRRKSVKPKKDDKPSKVQKISENYDNLGKNKENVPQKNVQKRQNLRNPPKRGANNKKEQGKSDKNVKNNKKSETDENEKRKKLSKSHFDGADIFETVANLAKLDPVVISTPVASRCLSPTSPVPTPIRNDKKSNIPMTKRIIPSQSQPEHAIPEACGSSEQFDVPETVTKKPKRTSIVRSRTVASSVKRHQSNVNEMNSKQPNITIDVHCVAQSKTIHPTMDTNERSPQNSIDKQSASEFPGDRIPNARSGKSRKPRQTIFTSKPKRSTRIKNIQENNPNLTKEIIDVPLANSTRIEEEDVLLKNVSFNLPKLTLEASSKTQNAQKKSGRSKRKTVGKTSAEYDDIEKVQQPKKPKGRPRKTRDIANNTDPSEDSGRVKLDTNGNKIDETKQTGSIEISSNNESGLSKKQTVVPEPVVENAARSQSLTFDQDSSDKESEEPLDLTTNKKGGSPKKQDLLLQTLRKSVQEPGSNDIATEFTDNPEIFDNGRKEQPPKTDNGTEVSKLRRSSRIRNNLSGWALQYQQRRALLAENLLKGFENIKGRRTFQAVGNIEITNGKKRKIDDKENHSDVIQQPKKRLRRQTVSGNERRTRLMTCG